MVAIPGYQLTRRGGFSEENPPRPRLSTAHLLAPLIQRATYSLAVSLALLRTLSTCDQGKSNDKTRIRIYTLRQTQKCSLRRLGKHTLHGLKTTQSFKYFMSMKDEIQTNVLKLNKG